MIIQIKTSNNNSSSNSIVQTTNMINNNTIRQIVSIFYHNNIQIIIWIIVILIPITKTLTLIDHNNKWIILMEVLFCYKKLIRKMTYSFLNKSKQILHRIYYNCDINFVQFFITN